MNIQFARSYLVNGKAYATLDEAKVASLQVIFEAPHDGDSPWTSSEIANRILQNADVVMDVLTTTATSKPAARRINGGTKRRKPKDATAQPQLPGQEAA